MVTIGGTGDEVGEEEAVVMAMDLDLDLEGAEDAVVEEEEVVVEEGGSMVTEEFRLEVKLEPQVLSALGRHIDYILAS